MKAIVFAAGIGSRLRPFTDSHPKALAPVGDKVALEIVLERLISAGVDAIVVNVHHFAAQIVDYLSSRDYPVKIEISDESDVLLDTGGAIAKIYRRSNVLSALGDDEPVIVHNADIITDAPLAGLASTLSGADAALLVDPARESSRKFLFGTDGILRGWINKTKGTVRPGGLDVGGLTEAAFGGVHALNKAAIADISAYCGDLHPFSITDYYIDRCADIRIKGYIPTEHYKWFDIGTPERLEAAQAF